MGRVKYQRVSIWPPENAATVTDVIGCKHAHQPWTPRSSLLLVTRTRQAAMTVYAKHLSDSADREIVPQFTPSAPPKNERLNSEHTVTTKCSFTRFGTINAWINCPNWSGRVWMGDSDMLIAVSCPGSVCVIFFFRNIWQQNPRQMLSQQPCPPCWLSSCGFWPRHAKMSCYHIISM